MSNSITTPQAERLHIALFGRRNSGKSTLINALTGQDTALVSPTAGTTTDPVSRAMEIPTLGACLLIDTPGFDDEGELGNMRVERTLQVMERTDIALLLMGEEGIGNTEANWLELLAKKEIPTVLILNKADTLQDYHEVAARIAATCGQTPVIVSAKNSTGIDLIRQAILEKLPADFGSHTITGDLVSEGDVVLLVMPQDAQAPRGRLILPQVQTIRELLDRRCLISACTPDKLKDSLQALAAPPRLIITDSQAFATVHPLVPPGTLLTSFSILFAGYKGDIDTFTAGATVIDSLTSASRILIAEACTHAPLTEDIGRVKLPNLLRRKLGDSLQIDVVSGRDFPCDLSAYDLIIHCGACMFNRKYVLSRIRQAQEQHIPITNYGIVLARLTIPTPQ